MINNLYQVTALDIDDPDARVALTNYFEYLSLDELKKIQPCASDKNPLQCLEDSGMRF